MDAQPAADRLDAVAHVAQPPLRRTVEREPRPVVAHLEAQRVVLGEVDPHARCRRSVLHRVLDGLHGGEVDGALDLEGMAGHAGSGDMDGDRGVARERLERAIEALLAERRGEDAHRVRAQVLEGSLGLDAECADRLGPRGGILVQRLLGEREPDPQRDQPLLGAVVQVALDPRALEIGRLRDPHAQLRELRRGPAEPGRGLLVAPSRQDERAHGRSAAPRRRGARCRGSARPAARDRPRRRR